MFIECCIRCGHVANLLSHLDPFQCPRCSLMRPMLCHRGCGDEQQSAIGQDQQALMLGDLSQALLSSLRLRFWSAGLLDVAGDDYRSTEKDQRKYSLHTCHTNRQRWQTNKSWKARLLLPRWRACFRAALLDMDIVTLREGGM